MELAHIFRKYRSSYLERFRVPWFHQKAIQDIIDCRTPVMGGETYYCKKCDELQYSYHSCKNRHCPKCQSEASEEWLEKQMQKLLPVNYFLLTFTIPQELRFLARSNQKLFYSILFKAAADSLKVLFADPRHIGGIPGIIGVLHTWTRQMLYHPHIHFIIPGVGYDFERNERKKASHKFLIPVKALSIIFRAKFRDLLKDRNPEIFRSIPAFIWRKKEFVTHSKPVGKGEAALRYLSQYIYKIAISNNRIMSMKNGMVTFRYRESGSKEWKYETVTVFEFMRRFLQHVLPSGFQKVRYYGFLSSASKKMFEQVKLLLWGNKMEKSEKKVKHQKRAKNICPHCNTEMKFIGRFDRNTRAPPWKIEKKFPISVSQTA